MMVDDYSPDGAYRAVLARTDDPERAEKVRVAKAVQDKMDMLRREGV